MLSASVNSAGVIKAANIDGAIRLVPARTDHEATLWQRESKIISDKTSQISQIAAH
jgi:hypothetical protein